MENVNDLGSIYNEQEYLHSVTPSTPMQLVVSTCVCCSSHWPMKNVTYSNKQAHVEQNDEKVERRHFVISRAVLEENKTRAKHRNRVVLTCEGM